MNTPRENAEQDQRRRDTESDTRYWRHREWEAAPLPGPAPLPNPAFQAEVEAKLAKSNAILAKSLEFYADFQAKAIAAGYINPDSAYYPRK